MALKILFFQMMDLFLTFYFVLEYSQLISQLNFVSGGQQRDSAIHIPVSILPQTPLPCSCHMILSRVPCVKLQILCYTHSHTHSQTPQNKQTHRETYTQTYLGTAQIVRGKARGSIQRLFQHQLELQSGKQACKRRPGSPVEPA